MKWSTFFLLLIFPEVLPIKVYQSTLDITNEKDLAGLHHQTSNSTKIQHDSFSVCVRFNYKRLAQNTVVILIHDTNCDSCEKEPSHPFFNLRAEYPIHLSFWGFGRYDLPEEPWASYIIPQEFLWITQKWNHMCMAFDKQTSHLSAVKVCR